MRYEGSFNFLTLQEDFPEKIKIDENTTMTIKDKQIIFNEFDRETDALSNISNVFDKGFTVGVKVIASTRHFEKTEKGFSVTENPVQYGNYAVLRHDCTMMDVMEAISNLVVDIRKEIVGEPEKA